MLPELRGFAIQSLGVLAGNGNNDALEILLDREKYGFLLSDTDGQVSHRNLPKEFDGAMCPVRALVACAVSPIQAALTSSAAGNGNKVLAVELDTDGPSCSAIAVIAVGRRASILDGDFKYIPRVYSDGRGDHWGCRRVIAATVVIYARVIAVSAATPRSTNRDNQDVADAAGDYKSKISRQVVGHFSHTGQFRFDVIVSRQGVGFGSRTGGKQIAGRQGPWAYEDHGFVQIYHRVADICRPGGQVPVQHFLRYRH
jgi:hypothetical protein